MHCEPIGILHTPYQRVEEMPVQPAGARGIAGWIELRPELVDGLDDLDGFSHIIVLYQFHRVGDVQLTVTPFLDNRPRGLFATRAPCRPNPIGLSILRLLRVDGDCLAVEDVDMLDQTPLLDLKPYVPAFDQPTGPVRDGWLATAAARISSVRSDERFKK
jgi:tRNA-Thr(GGU) m(6)t(6)A37 methyltransferase TsaA